MTNNNNSNNQPQKPANPPANPNQKPADSTKPANADKSGEKCSPADANKKTA